MFIQHVMNGQHKSGLLSFVLSFPLLSLSHPAQFFLLWIWLQSWLLRFHESLIPSGGDTVGPSSHCVHPKFPFQDASYSKPCSAKNKPQKNEMRHTRENRCAKALLHLIQPRYLPNVADCRWNYSESAAFYLCCENNPQGDKILRFVMPLFHTLTPLASLDVNSMKSLCRQRDWADCVLHGTYQGQQ